jgi:hypothetical protein
VRNFAILQDSCKTVRRWQRYCARIVREAQGILGRECDKRSIGKV